MTHSIGGCVARFESGNGLGVRSGNTLGPVVCSLSLAGNCSVPVITRTVRGCFLGGGPMVSALRRTAGVLSFYLARGMNGRFRMRRAGVRGKRIARIIYRECIQFCISGENCVVRGIRGRGNSHDEVTTNSIMAIVGDLSSGSVSLESVGFGFCCRRTVGVVGPVGLGVSPGNGNGDGVGGCDNVCGPVFGRSSFK